MENQRFLIDFGVPTENESVFRLFPARQVLEIIYHNTSSKNTENALIE
jgi:hypothetical protein